MMSKPPRLRAVFLAASTASLAVVGAWYGARLKQNQQVKQVRAISVPPPQFRIAYSEPKKMPADT